MRLLISLVLAVAAVFTVVPTAPASAASGSRAHPEGRWLVDGHGRALVLHGVNMVRKLDPYAPDDVGFGRDDARFLARNGFNTVRLGVIWRAVEPRPGTYDDRYLARIRHTTRVLADAGIWTLLDFHQDLFHERFEGEGAPTWAVRDDKVPAQPKAGFPYNYFAMPALNRAFDNFWTNARGPGKVGLQKRYAEAWAHVARYFRRTPRVLGLDLFNEPWPGSSWQQCANPAGCPAFDLLLEKFSQRAIRAIRGVDRRTTVFYEPNVLFNNGAMTHVTPRGKRLAFSFHDYCLTAEANAEGAGDDACAGSDRIVWRNARQHVRDSHDPALLTEFGATRHKPTLTTMVDRAARHRTGWQYWGYCGCGDPTTTGPGAVQALVHNPAKPPRGANVDQRKLLALSVPHPMAVAGTPKRYHFDRLARDFRVAWSTHRAGGKGRFRGGSRTTIAVPATHYPYGYYARVRGGHVVSAEDARTLVIAQNPGADRVRVTVVPD